jgi:hypothetical protein
MNKHITYIIAAFAFFFMILVVEARPAHAGADQLQRAVSALQSLPKYSGKIIATHIRKRGREKVFEVRILRPNDTIVLVYIDPRSGEVLGDSVKSKKKNRKYKN